MIGVHLTWAIQVPTAFALVPHDLLFFPRSVAEAPTDLPRWSVLPHGGHFVPAETPELLAAEYRAFFPTIPGHASDL